ncbi:MAG: DUF5606 domain-containing protein [Bacteroidales bacterium]|nr:DUF5606 domain-containing protein [Bacteroidales bacterium]
MLRKILSIAGKPGLYKLISQGKNMLIVESLLDGRRMPSHNQDKVVSLGEIAIYTEEDEKPLREVLALIKEHENGACVSFDIKNCDEASLRDYMESVLPIYDKDRVRVSDMRKLFTWYNLLISTGNDDFSAPEEEKTEQE